MKGYIIILSVWMATLSHAQVWRALGPVGSDQYSLMNSAWGGGTGQVHHFAFAKKSDGSGQTDWYCASPWGGLWKSDNEGKSWTDLNPQLEKVAGICSALEIAVDPQHPDTLYVANGRYSKSNTPDAPGVAGTGVFRSADGGRTFQPTGLKYQWEDDRHVPRLIFDPFTHTLFAVTDRGLYQSRENTDEKWQEVFDKENLYTVELSPGYAANTTVYAAGDDIFISKKGGRKGSFRTYSPSVIDALPALRTTRNINIKVAGKDNKDVLYALVYQDGEYYFLSCDGTKWEMKKSPVTGYLNIPTPDRMKFAVNPANPDNVYAGTTYVSRSDDGGHTWQSAGSYSQPGSQHNPLNIHGDIHAVEMIPSTGDVLIGTDGGVFRYLADEQRTVELNTGLNISQVLGMSAPVSAPRKIVIGKQDTGFDIYDGRDWHNFEGGDGFSVHSLTADSTVFIGKYGMRVIAEGGADIRRDRPSCKGNESALFLCAAEDPKDPSRIFSAGTNISFSTDACKTLTTIYKFNSAVGQPIDFSTQIETIGVGHDSQANESVVYATSYGFINGSITRMVCGRIGELNKEAACHESLCATCWQKVTLPHEGLEWLDATSYNVSGLAVSPRDPSELWICYSHNDYAKADLKVFHSTDGGATWTPLDEGLPAYTSCTTIINDATLGYLYLGTAIGAYVNRNDGTGWKPLGDGLPKSYVEVLEVQPAIGKIRAALYGRGVWDADLPK